MQSSSVKKTAVSFRIRPPVWGRRTAPFFEASIPLPTVVVNHVVPIFGRKPPRIESDATGFGICIVLAIVSAHAIVFPSSANCFATLSWLTPSSSHSISPGSTLQGCGCDRCGARPVRKRTVQPVCFFRIAYYFFAKNMQKTDPVRVPDSGPKMGSFSGPL